MISNDDIEAMADKEFMEYWKHIQETKIFEFPPNMQELMNQIFEKNINFFSNMSTENFFKMCYKQAYMKMKEVEEHV